MDFNWLAAIGLFLAATALDALFVMYTFSVVNTKPLVAGNLSVLMYGLEALGVLNYVNNKWYLIPLGAGAFVGSYGVVKWEATKKKKQK